MVTKSHQYVRYFSGHHLDELVDFYLLYLHAENPGEIGRAWRTNRQPLERVPRVLRGSPNRRHRLATFLAEYVGQQRMTPSRIFARPHGSHS